MAKVDPVDMYRREVATVRPLTTDEEAHFFREAQRPGQPGEDAKRRLIESNLCLVLAIADRHSASGVPLLDLVQEGNLALMRAIDGFPQSGRPGFSTYASDLIEKAISKDIENRVGRGRS